MSQAPASRAETKAKLIDLYRATAQVVGGKWTIGTEFLEDCVLADGSNGSEYERLESAPGVADAPTVAGKVRDLWVSRGYKATTVSKDKLGASIVDYPRDGNRVYLRLTINEHAASLEGSGGCATS